jgi:hypothetical protein
MVIGGVLWYHQESAVIEASMPHHRPHPKTCRPLAWLRILTVECIWLYRRLTLPRNAESHFVLQTPVQDI